MALPESARSDVLDGLGIDVQRRSAKPTSPMTRPSGGPTSGAHMRVVSASTGALSDRLASEPPIL